MSEYIDRQALDNVFASIISWAIANAAYEQGLRAAHNALLNFPADDVAPARHGAWNTEKGRDTIQCSSCGFKMFPLDAYQKGEWPNMSVGNCRETGYKPRFCPDCGAKMDA